MGLVIGLLGIGYKIMGLGKGNIVILLLIIIMTLITITY